MCWKRKGIINLILKQTKEKIIQILKVSDMQKPKNEKKIIELKAGSSAGNPFSRALLTQYLFTKFDHFTLCYLTPLYFDSLSQKLSFIIYVVNSDQALLIK